MDNNIESVDDASKRRLLNRQTSDLLKLPTEILDYIFGYLPLKSLAAAGRTCLLLKQLCGFYLQKHYTGAGYYFEKKCNGELYICDRDGADLTDYIQFIGKLYIDKQFLLRVFMMNYSKFHQLTHICFFHIDFTNATIERTKGNMCKVVTLKMEFCKIYENFLDFFPNIKRLALIMTGIEDIQYDYIVKEWFGRTYPKLEQFDLGFAVPMKLPIVEFLEVNRTVRIFETTFEHLMFNAHSLKAAKNVSLDELVITFAEVNFQVSATDFRFLKELEDLGFYKQLRLNFYIRFNESYMNELKNFNSLTKLFIRINKHLVKDPCLEFSSLTNLREICFQKSQFIADVNLMARSLTNLEQIYFHKANITHIMPFVREAKKLKKIRINQLEDKKCFHQSEITISLAALNEERKLLQGATKLTLYVSENVYFTTKSANWRTDLELINLKNFRSCLWKPTFDPFLIWGYRRC